MEKSILKERSNYENICNAFKLSSKTIYSDQKALEYLSYSYNHIYYNIVPSSFPYFCLSSILNFASFLFIRETRKKKEYVCLDIKHTTISIKINFAIQIFFVS